MLVPVVTGLVIILVIALFLSSLGSHLFDALIDAARLDELRGNAYELVHNRAHLLSHRDRCSIAFVQGTTVVGGVGSTTVVVVIVIEATTTAASSLEATTATTSSLEAIMANELAGGRRVASSLADNRRATCLTLKEDQGLTVARRKVHLAVRGNGIGVDATGEAGYIFAFLFGGGGGGVLLLGGSIGELTLAQSLLLCREVGNQFSCSIQRGLEMDAQVGRDADCRLDRVCNVLSALSVSSSFSCIRAGKLLTGEELLIGEVGHDNGDDDGDGVDDGYDEVLGAMDKEMESARGFWR
jgi:hypothetical protein